MKFGIRESINVLQEHWIQKTKKLSFFDQLNIINANVGREVRQKDVTNIIFFKLTLFILVQLQLFYPEHAF